MTDPQNPASSDDSQRAPDANPYDSIRAEPASDAQSSSPYGEMSDGSGDHDRHARSGSPYGQSQAGPPANHQPGPPDTPPTPQGSSPYGQQSSQQQPGQQPPAPQQPHGSQPPHHAAQPPQASPYGQAPGQPPHGAPYGQQPGAPGQGNPYGQQHYAQQQFGHQPHPGAPGAPGAMYSFETDKQVGMFAHLLNIVGVFGPLIIWMVTKDKGPLANSEGKEATNFGITVAIAQVACWFVTFILSFVGIGLLFAFVPMAISIAVVIFAIIGGLHVNNTGTPYRYPINIRFIK